MKSKGFFKVMGNHKNGCVFSHLKKVKMISLGWALLMAILLLTGLSASSATYYVSTTGNNSNNGTSTSTPWRNINYAVNYSGLVAGDIIYVRGGTYYERSVMTKSGNSTSRITVKNYTGETPIIDGTGVTFVANEDHQGLFDVRASYVTIDGFTVRNSNPGTDEANATGICVRGPGVRDVTIKNCTTSNTRSSGIAIWGQTTGTDYSGCQYIIIENCDISNAVNDGYQEHLTIAKGVDNFTIRNNKVHDGSQNSLPRSPNLPIGIDAKINVRNGQIYGNEVYNLPESNGIYVDSWDSEAYNIEIYNNIVRGVAHTGIVVGGEEGGTSRDIKVYNNLVYSNSEFGLGIWGSNTGTNNNIYNVSFYNNTVYGNSYYAAWVNNSSTGAIKFINNIFSQNAWGNAVNLMTANKSNVNVSNNMTNGVQNAYHSGSEYVKGTNSNDSDPVFVNTSGNNYRLQSSSPAVNSGTTTGITLPSTDLDGNARVSGGTVDRGAYEYGSTTAPPCQSCNVEGNILSNPGFESDLTTGWTDDWGNSTRVSGTYNSGTYSLRIGTGQGGRAQILTSGFTVGAEYKLTAYCKLSATGAPAGTNVGVICKNSSGTRTGTFTSSDITSTSWTQKSVVFTIPANTVRIEINVWYPGGTPYVYVDDFVLQKNMLQNPGFESALTVGWTADWGNTARVSGSNEKKTGTYGLKVGPAQGGRAQILTSGFTVGNTYTVSAYCRLSATGAPAGTNIGAICKNSSGTRTGTFTSPDITTTSWAQKTVTFTVPSGTTSIEVNVWYPGGTPSVYVDDFAMLPGSTPLKSAEIATASAKVELEKSIKVYPNPVTEGKITISINGIEGEKVISMYDLAGRMVQQNVINNTGSPLIELDNLKNTGLYILKIKTRENEFTEKLIVR